MTIIANKPFTQLLNLNILDELRVDGVLVTATERQIVEITVNYTVDVDDDFIVGTGVLDVSLLPIFSAQKEVTIKAQAASTLTIIPFGSDVIEAGGTSVSSNTSVTLLPTSAGWVIV